MTSMWTRTGMRDDMTNRSTVMVSIFYKPVHGFLTVAVLHFESSSNTAFTLTCPLETVIFRSQALNPVFFTDN